MTDTQMNVRVVIEHKLQAERWIEQFDPKDTDFQVLAQDTYSQLVATQEKLVLALSRLATRDDRIALLSQRVTDACESAVNLRGSDVDWLLGNPVQEPSYASQ